MWYTEKRAEEGPVFGSADNWNGLGIFFDSFDNDGLHNNPYISVVLNDGTKSYDHDTYVTGFSHSFSRTWLAVAYMTVLMAGSGVDLW